MSEVPPRLRLWKTILFYLLAAPLITWFAALAAAPLAGGPFSPMEILGNPQRLLSELVYSYLLGAVPAGLLGATLAAFSPKGVNLPIASTVIGSAFFYVMGYSMVKETGAFFAIIGGIAGLVCGAIVWRLRPSFTARAL